MVGIRRAVLLQLAVLAAVAIAIVLASRHFPVAEMMESLQQRVVRFGAWSALLYPLLYAACNLLLLPGGVLSLGGGFFFGLWWGFAIIFVGNLIGAAAAFLIGRFAGRTWVARRVARNRTLSAIEPMMEAEGWKIVLLTQLHPLFPTSLLNYFYGLTSIRFSTCMIWVAIGQAPGLFLYAYLGTLGQLGLRLLRGRTHPHPVEYWIWLGGFATAAIFLAWLAKIAVRLLRRAQALSNHEPAMAYIEHKRLAIR